MKLVYVFNGRLPTEKAHGLQVVKSCEAFAQAGFQVELVNSFRLNSIKETIFEYYQIKTNFQLRNIWGLDLSFLPNSASRLFHFVQTSVSGLYAVCFLASHYRRKSCIFYARDYFSIFLLCLFGYHPVAEFHDYRTSKKRRAIQFILDKSRKIVVNSEGTKKLIKEHYNVPENKILVAHNGVDVDFFNISDSAENARSELGLPNGFIVGYVGQLELLGHDKGVGMLLEAFAKVADPETRLVVVGGPNQAANRYKDRARELGISSERVAFRGHVPYRMIPKYLRALDVVVVTVGSGSHVVTTSPIKLFEYMAAGKAIIAPDVPSIQKYLNSRNSLLYAHEDSGSLADMIRKATSAGVGQALGTQALADAAGHTWRARAEKIKEFIIS